MSTKISKLNNYEICIQTLDEEWNSGFIFTNKPYKFHLSIIPSKKPKKIKQESNALCSTTINILCINNKEQQLPLTNYEISPSHSLPIKYNPSEPQIISISINTLSLTNGNSSFKLQFTAFTDNEQIIACTTEVKTINYKLHLMSEPRQLYENDMKFYKDVKKRTNYLRYKIALLDHNMQVCPPPRSITIKCKLLLESLMANDKKIPNKKALHLKDCTMTYIDNDGYCIISLRVEESSTKYEDKKFQILFAADATLITANLDISPILSLPFLVRTKINKYRLKKNDKKLDNGDDSSATVSEMGDSKKRKYDDQNLSLPVLKRRRKQNNDSYEAYIKSFYNFDKYTSESKLKPLIIQSLRMLSTITGRREYFVSENGENKMHCLLRCLYCQQTAYFAIDPHIQHQKNCVPWKIYKQMEECLPLEIINEFNAKNEEYCHIMHNMNMNIMTSTNSNGNGSAVNYTSPMNSNSNEMQVMSNHVFTDIPELPFLTKNIFNRMMNTSIANDSNTNGSDDVCTDILTNMEMDVDPIVKKTQEPKSENSGKDIAQQVINNNLLNGNYFSQSLQSVKSQSCNSTMNLFSSNSSIFPMSMKCSFDECISNKSVISNNMTMMNDNSSCEFGGTFNSGMLNKKPELGNKGFDYGYMAYPNTTDN